MAERLRSIVVTVALDTNKERYQKRFEMREDESREEFAKRVERMILTAGSNWT